MDVTGETNEEVLKVIEENPQGVLETSRSKTRGSEHPGLTPLGLKAITDPSQVLDLMEVKDVQKTLTPKEGGPNNRIEHFSKSK